jgi:hypothetical protein
LKTATFTVRGSVEQSRRWKMAAEAEGHRSAGTWLAAAADAYLKVRARAGLPIPLAWRRYGHFEVKLDGGTVTVQGQMSPPFGTFRGNADGPRGPGSGPFALVYLPDARIVASLRSSAQCKALASELAAVLIRGDPLPNPGAVVERHEREAK